MSKKDISPEQQLTRLQKLMSWLINGYGRHGIPLDLWKSKNLTPEWVEEHYNVNF